MSISVKGIVFTPESGITEAIAGVNFEGIAIVTDILARIMRYLSPNHRRVPKRQPTRSTKPLPMVRAVRQK